MAKLSASRKLPKKSRCIRVSRRFARELSVFFKRLNEEDEVAPLQTTVRFGAALSRLLETAVRG
jgi:hypothetical protein